MTSEAIEASVTQYAIEDGQKMQNLSQVAIGVMQEINILRGILSDTDCACDEDNDIDISPFDVQQKLQLQELLLRKYALLEEIDTVRANILDR